ncbi:MULTISPECIES: hypothetical protein [unclassified Nocardioides]|jgi:RNA polymerase sigma-70 factor (ECF subfamily)|uniref:hypothetical protein n=1 Tax=unclassified Nocardioides TaxID=2615069 RepID=UPI001153C464|nr:MULTISPECIES: hypothetical protein [unclassified Nocardioides]TQK69371.1 RNA polymerase sigma-70 factor (ECF subfamily) [Nocardioides sp. SLBN-35]WGY01330.1 hypothetical protein QI633_22660 [Nocardioides sp. QY071]
MSKANPSDADLRRLLVRAATGDVEAFLDFYDATCAVTWRLELCRHGDPALAKDSTTRRYVGAWLHAAAQAGSGLSARAWLLSLSPDLMPPLSRTDALPVGA